MWNQATAAMRHKECPEPDIPGQPFVLPSLSRCMHACSRLCPSNRLWKLAHFLHTMMSERSTERSSRRKRECSGFWEHRLPSPRRSAPHAANRRDCCPLFWPGKHFQMKRSRAGNTIHIMPVQKNRYGMMPKEQSGPDKSLLTILQALDMHAFQLPWLGAWGRKHGGTSAVWTELVWRFHILRRRSQNVCRSSSRADYFANFKNVLGISLPRSNFSGKILNANEFSVCLTFI